MRLVGLLVVAALSASLAACAPKTTEEPQVDATAPTQSLPAPKPEGVAVTVRKEDAGKAIAAKVGDKIAVELVGVPTAGYVWEPADVPTFLEKSGDAGGPTSSAQLQPGFAGGNHWEVTVFTVKAAGEGSLSFKQVRPWESTEPPVDTFAVTIKAE